MKNDLAKLLIKHEGLKLDVYQCPAGYPTIGVGRNLQTNGLTKDECDYLNLGTYDRNAVIAKLEVRGITEQEAYYLLINDIDNIIHELLDRFEWVEALPDEVKIVLISMAFNMGMSGLLGFKKTLKMIEMGDYKSASVEMLDSKWAKQVGSRAVELSEMLAMC